MMSVEDLCARLTDSQPRVVEEDTPFVSCPWCPDFDRTDRRNAGVSHGICGSCSRRMTEEIRASDALDAVFDQVAKRMREHA